MNLPNSLTVVRIFLVPLLVVVLLTSRLDNWQLAGMTKEQTKQTLSGIPGMTQIPVLGALFKSRDYVNRQTQLMGDGG